MKLASRDLGVYSGCIQDHLGDGVNPNNCDYEKTYRQTRSEGSASEMFKM